MEAKGENVRLLCPPRDQIMAASLHAWLKGELNRLRRWCQGIISTTARLWAAGRVVTETAEMVND